MSRRHMFVIVVLLGAAAVAGLLAMTRTAALGSPANASPARDDAISFRLQKLDRLEASLRKQLEARGPAASPPSVTVLRSSSPSTQIGDIESYDEEHEDDGGTYGIQGGDRDD